MNAERTHCGRPQPKPLCNSNLARAGLTLLEVVLALAIFVGSMAALGQLINTGVQSAVRARLETQAILRCESKLAEVIAGVEALESTDELPFEDNPAWTWSMEVVDGPHADLLMMYVTVNYAGGSSLANVSYSLERYVRNPQIFIDAQEAEAAAAAEETE